MSTLQLFPLAKAVGIELAYERHLEAQSHENPLAQFIHGDVCDESNEEIMEVYKEEGKPMENL